MGFQTAGGFSNALRQTNVSGGCRPGSPTDGYVCIRSDRVEIIYHHFKSMGVQILLRETYLPIDLTHIIDEEEQNKER